MTREAEVPLPSRRRVPSPPTVIVGISVAASSVGSDLHRCRWKSDTPPGLRIQPEPSSAAQHNPVRRINPERSSRSLETDLNAKPLACSADSLLVGLRGSARWRRTEQTQRKKKNALQIILFA